MFAAELPLKLLPRPGYTLETWLRLLEMKLRREVVE